MPRRDPASVTLVAISKTFGAEAIEPVIAAGQRVFGENRVQEAKAKWPALKENYPGIELHLVGPLQSNKTKEAVALFDAIHAVDRPSLAEALAKEITGRAGSRRCSSRSIPAPSRRRPACCRKRRTHSSSLPRDTGSTIAGLMCIPPDDEAPAPHFALTAKIARAQRAQAAVHGHERRFRDRHPVRRDPCAGRQRIFGAPRSAS